MSKKSKRQVRRNASTSPDKTVPEVLSGNRPTGFSPDYQFVIRDIRRVGVLAGLFIITLVTLSFFLH
jgi:hypothetical protein